jgi:cytochrome c-type biogenesis protein CcmH/NrfF
MSASPRVGPVGRTGLVGRTDLAGPIGLVGRVGLALVTLALLLAASGSAAIAHPTLPQLEPQVMCVSCKIPLSVANSPEATQERTFIKEQIAAGQDEAQIKRALVAQYGPTVLSLPSTKGFQLSAYLVPIAVVLALLVTLALLLPRWRRAARAQERSAGPATPALSHADAERLERDMKRFD